MANFVEQAVLRLDDQTSGPARAINKELRSLFRTAKRFQGLNKSLHFDVSGIGKASTQIGKLQRQLAQLQQQARKGVNIAGGRGGGGRGGNGGPRAPAGRPGGGGNAFAAFNRNLLGAAIGLGAVSTAASLAAAALRKVGELGVQRSRTNLQTMLFASAEQRAIFAAEDAKTGRGAPPLPLPRTLFDQFRTSLLGDVQGNAAERARSADSLARLLERELLPVIFAGNTNQSPEEAAAGLRNYVKALNLASADLTDAAGNLTKDGKRVFDGLAIAIRGNPELSGQLTKTTLANAKSAGFTLNETGLARLLIAAGDKGQRVGNEVFQTIQSLSGRINNKTLNNALEKAGLVEGFERAKKGSGHRAGSIIPGTGRAVDAEMLANDPGQWLNKNVRPLVEAEIRRNRGKDADVENASFVQEALGQILPGLKQTALIQVSDLLVGLKQSEATLDQARLSREQDLAKSIKDNWASQLENMKTAGADVVANFTNAAAEAANLAAAFQSVTNVLRGQGSTKENLAVGGAALTGAALTGLITKSLFGRIGSMFGAGTKPRPGAAPVAPTTTPSGVPRISGGTGLAGGIAKGLVAGAVYETGKWLIDTTLDAIGGTPTPSVRAELDKSILERASDLAKRVFGSDTPATSTKPTAAAGTGTGTSGTGLQRIPEMSPEAKAKLLGGETIADSAATDIRTAATEAKTALSTGVQATADALTTAFAAGAATLSASLAGAFSSGAGQISAALAAGVNVRMPDARPDTGKVRPQE